MRTILSLLLTLLFTSPAFGEELRLYVAAGVKSPLVEMAAAYGRRRVTRSPVSSIQRGQPNNDFVPIRGQRSW